MEEKRFRHSFYQLPVAEIQNVNQVGWNAGNSPSVIFKHYGNWCRMRKRRSGSAFRHALTST